MLMFFGITNDRDDDGNVHSSVVMYIQHFVVNSCEYTVYSYPTGTLLKQEGNAQMSHNKL